MPRERIIIEIEADILMLESLLQPAIDEGVISVLTVCTHTNPPKTSIVEDWANEAGERNEFVSRRYG
jgi:predicted anti-sigma-YlaC factor YlaD